MLAGRSKEASSHVSLQFNADIKHSLESSSLDRNSTQTFVNLENGRYNDVLVLRDLPD